MAFTKPVKKSTEDTPEKIERNHRYIVTIFGPEKAYDVFVFAHKQHLTVRDLASAKTSVLKSYFPEGLDMEELVVASVSYLGYTSDTEFGIETNGEQVKE